MLFTFCVQAITGFFLWVYYSPSAQTAWESVYFLQYEVAGGWLLRAIHHYSAHVLLALLILAVVQSILTAAYRAPRELVFWATVGLGLCALAAVLTGDLLSWDQNGYAATKTRTGFLTFLPLVGDGLLKIAIGGPGPALGHLTLTRFFALHVGLFAAGFVRAAVIRGVLARRASAVAAAAGDAVPYWPAQAWRGAVACLAVMAVILLLACQHGVTLPQAGRAAALARRHRSGQRLQCRPARMVPGGRVRVLAPVPRRIGDHSDLYRSRPAGLHLAG